ncbi:hypothetical protein JMV73_01055 [Klebsiella pneumoniae]|nr:hypothetical protein JMV73_01055 [Klebsiella pneumoniae]
MDDYEQKPAVRVLREDAALPGKLGAVTASRCMKSGSASRELIATARCWVFAGYAASISARGRCSALPGVILDGVSLFILGKWVLKPEFRQSGWSTR